jgi:hypothetical protein
LQLNWASFISLLTAKKPFDEILGQNTLPKGSTPLFSDIIEDKDRSYHFAIHLWKAYHF